MKPVEFCYWLQGLFELSEPETLNAKQTAAIRNHLALVFEHAIDPSYTSHLKPEDANRVQAVLQATHDGTIAAADVVDDLEDEVDEDVTTTPSEPPQNPMDYRDRRPVDRSTSWRDRVYKC